MQAPPDDLLHTDFTSFPTVDPVQQEANKKAAKEAEKEQKAREAQEKRDAKAEQERAKKMQDMPDTKAKAAAAKSSSNRVLNEHKIRLYFSHFGDKLGIKQPKSLGTLDDAGVAELLHSIELTLQSAGGIEQAANGYQAAAAALEQVSLVFNPLGLQLVGPQISLSAAIAQTREKWQDLVTEFAIAHAEWFMMGPGKRLLMFTAQLVLTVDGANKAGAALARDQPVSAPMEEASKGL